MPLVPLWISFEVPRKYQTPLPCHRRTSRAGPPKPTLARQDERNMRTRGRVGGLLLLNEPAAAQAKLEHGLPGDAREVGACAGGIFETFGQTAGIGEEAGQELAPPQRAAAIQGIHGVARGDVHAL